MKKILLIIPLIIGIALFVLGTDRSFNYGKDFKDFTYSVYQDCLAQNSPEVCSLQQNPLLQSQMMENIWFLSLALAIPIFSLVLFRVFENK